MFIVPTGKPILSNLNSYYVNVEKLLEHFQGEIGSGTICFQNPISQGWLLFDTNDILNGCYRENGKTLTGERAIELLLTPGVGHNFSIGIQQIESEQVYYWANIPNAQVIHKDLSSEFTNLDGLIKKMRTEQVTGYIDITFSLNPDQCILFFSQGDLMGASYSWEKEQTQFSKKRHKELLEKITADGAVFNVSTIDTEQTTTASAPAAPSEETDLDILSMLSELLVLTEQAFAAEKRLKGQFNTLLRKKFIEKADPFPFLDPFAGEFEYVQQEVKLTGETEPKVIATGVVACVKELAVGSKLWSNMEPAVTKWRDKHAPVLKGLAIEI